jgi:lysophospholipase L1-like esterase
MRRVLFVSVWLVFVFLLLQAAGYIFYKLEVSKPVSGYGYPAGLTVPHAELGYHYQPHFSGHFKGTAYHDVVIATNALGFRDADFAPAPGEARRIAVLGDSVVFGAGVDADDRFTACLGDAVDAGGGTRVLNLGVNAYTAGHYATLAGLDFLGADPDAVLLGITLNDFEPMDSVGPAERMQRHAESLHKPTWIARIQERIGRTYAARFIDEIDTRLDYALMNADEREDYHTKWMRTVVAGWRQDDNRARFESRLDELTATLDAASLPRAFILFPELNALRNPAEFGAPRLLLRDLLERRGLDYCDPYDAFAGRDDLDTLFLQRDSIHFSPKGHLVLCDAVAQCAADGRLTAISRER